MLWSQNLKLFFTRIYPPVFVIEMILIILSREDLSRNHNITSHITGLMTRVQTDTDISINEGLPGVDKRTIFTPINENIKL